MSRTLSCRIALASAALFILVFSPTILSAQQSPADVPAITIRANTRLVVVDVVVTDKKGQAVTGLKAEDFTVEENGKKQKVSVFVPPGTVQPAAQPLPPGILSNRPEFLRPPGVPTVLLLDVANSPFKDQAYGRLQMLKYVQEQEESGTPMAVMTLTDRLHVMQEFTSDPQVLLTAIKNFKPEEQLLRPGAPTPESHAALGSTGAAGGSAIAAGIAMASQAVQDFADIQVTFDLERRTLITIDAMRSLSRMLGGLPGRKNVVWLTANLPFDLVPEDRVVSDAELMETLPNVKQKSLGTIATGSLAAQQRAMHGQEIREAESRLASASVAIYPIDLLGLVSGMESSAAKVDSISDTALSDRASARISGLVNSHGTMEEVAAQTGGKAYFNQNEIKEGVALAASDEKASYSLGYYPENKKWDGKLRNIKVKVAQGDTQLRYRKGYFAIEPGPAKEHNYEQDVAAALQFDAPATQVSFMAQAKPTDPGKVRVIFLVDAHTLTAEDSGGNKKMNVNLYATVWGSGDKNMADAERQGGQILRRRDLSANSRQRHDGAD